MAAYRICCRSISGRLKEARAGQQILCAVVIRSFRLFIRLVFWKGVLTTDPRATGCYEKTGRGFLAKAQRENEM